MPMPAGLGVDPWCPENRVGGCWKHKDHLWGHQGEARVIVTSEPWVHAVGCSCWPFGWHLCSPCSHWVLATPFTQFPWPGALGPDSQVLSHLLSKPSFGGWMEPGRGMPLPILGVFGSSADHSPGSLMVPGHCPHPGCLWPPTSPLPWVGQSLLALHPSNSRGHIQITAGFREAP